MSVKVSSSLFANVSVRFTDDLFTRFLYNWEQLKVFKAQHTHGAPTQMFGWLDQDCGQIDTSFTLPVKYYTLLF